MGGFYPLLSSPASSAALSRLVLVVHRVWKEAIFIAGNRNTLWLLVVVVLLWVFYHRKHIRAHGKGMGGCLRRAVSLFLVGYHGIFLYKVMTNLRSTL